jgi:hypothetical protein
MPGFNRITGKGEPPVPHDASWSVDVKETDPPIDAPPPEAPDPSEPWPGDVFDPPGSEDGGSPMGGGGGYGGPQANQTAQPAPPPENPPEPPPADQGRNPLAKAADFIVDNYDAIKDLAKLGDAGNRFLGTKNSLSTMLGAGEILGEKVGTWVDENLLGIQHKKDMIDKKNDK